MKYFGSDKWTKGREKIEPLLGWMCGHCSELIGRHDDGVLMPSDSPLGVVFHRECLIRTLLGSVGHIKKKCSCFGGTEEDPPGMSLRQAAQAALEALYGKEEVV